MKLIKDIVKVVSSNFIMLISNLVIGFLLPLYLSVQEFGLYRQYMLYVGYIAIFNLGYVDGIYIKYGGKENNDVDKFVLRKEHQQMLVFQGIVTLSMVLISLYFNNIVLLLMSISIIPINLSGFHKMYYQATGQFSKYSFNNIIFTILNMTFILFAIFILNAKYFQIYTIISIIVYIITLLIMENDFSKNTKNKHYKSKPIDFFGYIKVGIFILFGNMSVLLFNSVGLWFSNLFLSIDKFAMYSFANSILNMILSLVTAAGLTFYNYIAKNDNLDFLFKVKQILFFIGISSGIAFFLLKFIIIHFISKYIPSVDIIAISFVSLPYMMIINVLLLNLYKVKKSEKEYLFTVIFMLVLNIIITSFLFIFNKNIISVSIASSSSFILWYFYSTTKDFKFLRSSKKELLLIVLHILVFLGTANFFNEYLGIGLYLLFILILLFLNKNYLSDFLSLLKDKGGQS